MQLKTGCRECTGGYLETGTSLPFHQTARLAPRAEQRISSCSCADVSLVQPLNASPLAHTLYICQAYLISTFEGYSIVQALGGFPNHLNAAP